MILFYEIIYTIFILPLMLLNRKTSQGKEQRLGRYEFKNKDKTLWIHAVSVGEISALLNFIKKIQGVDVVLTTSTPQGFEFAQSKLKDTCKQIVYFPYDCPFSVRKAIEAINPSIVFVMETEIWPVFLAELKRAKVPVAIINARISDSTYKAYKFLGFFFSGILKNVSTILAQSEDDAKRFINIGANPSSVRVMGNIKFDIYQPDCPDMNLKLEDYPLFIAGSTHQSEDKIAIDAYLAAKQTIENLKLLIAPRHMERVEEIKSLLYEYCLSFVTRSSGKTFADTDVMILDTTGELALMYANCKVAFIGGSFTKTGGHNPLEASIWGKPVLSGPNYKNFRQIYSELLKFSCAKIANTPEELTKELELLLTNDDYYNRTVINIEKVFETNRGATEYLLDLLNKWREYGNKI